ncbi:MAG: hypothetical protein Q7S83_03630 [bacterium]|nr:hypothetical protein [bacterium]
MEYIKLKRRKDNLIILRYPDGHEVVSLVSEVQHPVIREALESRSFRGGLDLVASSAIAKREDVLQALDRESLTS